MKSFPDLAWLEAEGLDCRHGSIGKIVRKTLLDPEIVEPAHGDEISEPLMYQFVQDERRAVEQVATRRCRRKQNCIFTQKCCPGMLHASKWKTRKEHLIVF